MKLKSSNRSGATAVEFAICAPIVFLFFFAAFEFSRVNVIRHAADVAAYEGAREGIMPGGSAAKVSDRATRFMSAVGIGNFNVTTIPARIDEDTPSITVRIDVDLSQNLLFAPSFFNAGGTITGVSNMTREGFTAPGA